MRSGGSVPDYSVSVIESQADWLTVTVHDATKQLELRSLATNLSKEEELARRKGRHFGLNGYRGWAIGRVRYGELNNWGLAQLSGQFAEDHLEEFLELADNVTRLDLAVTVQSTIPDTHLGDNAYATACWHRERHPHSARVKQTRNDDGGCTVEIGSRRSDYHARIYDKQHEREAERDVFGASHYARCWRYELELHDHLAQGLALSHAGASNRPAHAQGVVHDYFRRHGVEPVFTYDGGRVLVPGFSRRSDFDTTLGWFRDQVSGRLEWALTFGDRAEVLASLGLADQVQQLHKRGA
jgi:hypothetical protein